MMRGGIGNLMKQAQKMQENMQKAQDELAKVEVTGEAGGGVVKATVTCRNDVKKIEIDDALLGDDKEMLEDLIAAALNDALKKAEEKSQETMGSMTAGLNLPPGMKLPF
ncbi:MAG: YbaB/EbfC family nucleoid-associated protein [Gammaproteobacteria bacterium]|nr:YbaB/EbfC family nucleoid-associated protein [Gammaproteobacteria bacterium]